MFDLELLYKKLPKLGQDGRYIVGYSGGLDSHVLLHSLVALRERHSSIVLHAVHIDHGLSPHSEEWAQHCRQVCVDLGVTLSFHSVSLNIHSGESIEAMAREARYPIFADHLQSGDGLLTAHTCDDQAETLLLQLLRGAGPKGLASMPALKPLEKGMHARPLLAFSRDDLHHYAEQHHLHWIEDESNEDRRFDRNFLRHDIVPNLKRRWPQVMQTLARSAQHQAQAAQLLDELADADLQQVQTSTSKSLRIDLLLLLSEARMRNVLRRWIDKAGQNLPSTLQLQHIVDDVIKSKSDAMPLFMLPHYEIRRFKQQLFLLSKGVSHQMDQVIPWDLTAPLVLPNQLGTLIVESKSSGRTIVDTSKIDKNKITVQFRAGGERISPVGREGSRSLKKLFQEWQIAPWERINVPLLYHDEVLMAVVGYCVSQDFAAREHQPGLTIRLET